MWQSEENPQNRTIICEVELVQSWLSHWESIPSRTKLPGWCKLLLLTLQLNPLALCGKSCVYWATQPVAPPSDVVLMWCQLLACVIITYLATYLCELPAFSSQSQICVACWMLSAPTSSIHSNCCLFLVSSIMGVGASKLSLGYCISQNILQENFK